MACVKISVLVWYMGLFQTRGFRVSSWILIVISVLGSIAGSLEGILHCHPASYFWDKTTPGGYCDDLFRPLLSAALVGVATNICILLLPTYVLSQLKISRGRKIAVTSVFLLGGV
ncbi:hypothetical protein BKA67DRAFT_567095 [Truncatella angustata]|uniref:Rhodopsin domain-containing protein n=1 Tax=Truncatella angustata TaxID=152316 RepID=A0A9P8UI45_9PEZI|nr:uncharacterized protein BKA67DRAFT_567095 [Truncatella angustata]KAH6652645.1 hypothetical protein BKA67DRAFT_567095 [Truncatella angustata]